MAFRVASLQIVFTAVLKKRKHYSDKFHCTDHDNKQGIFINITAISSLNGLISLSCNEATLCFICPSLQYFMGEMSGFIKERLEYKNEFKSVILQKKYKYVQK